MGKIPDGFKLEIKKSPHVGHKRATQLDELLTIAFDVESKMDEPGIRRSYYDDFPVWRPGASPDVTFYSLTNDHDELVSTIGIRLGSLRALDGTRAHVGLIGAVATARDHRGRGYAGLLMESAINDIKRTTTDALVLWDSSQSLLYQRLGFVPFRAEYLFRLQDFAIPMKRKDETFYRGWSDKIFQAVVLRPSGLKYEYRDLDWYRRHRNTQWYWIERDQVCVAWCAVHRGIDLNGIVHEWHGPGDSLQFLLSEVSSFEPGALLMGPEPPRAELSFEKTAQGLILPLRDGLDWSKWWFWGLDAA